MMVESLLTLPHTQNNKFKSHSVITEIWCQHYFKFKWKITQSSWMFFFFFWWIHTAFIVQTTNWVFFTFIIHSLLEFSLSPSLYNLLAKYRRVCVLEKWWQDVDKKKRGAQKQGFPSFADSYLRSHPSHLPLSLCQGRSLLPPTC